MPISVRRIAMIIGVLVAMGVVLPAVAQAEPPSNDDFGASTMVAAIPFAVQLDTSGATGASDDPFWCNGFDIGGTVWFSYTATENALLRATTAGSDHWTILSASTGVRGELVPVQDGCDLGTNNGAAVTFRATAGVTYHFMVAGYHVPGGGLSFGLQAIAPAPNDNFADAEPISTLPTTRNVDLSIASTEPDEFPARCASSGNHTVWYAFTLSTTTSVLARVGQSENAVSVYTGNALLDLREIGCERGSSFVSLLFRATAGVTYYIKVTGSGRNGPDTLHLTEAPPLQPFFTTSPSDPTIYEETQFHADSGQFNVPIASGEWDFGDGTTAPVGEFGTAHHYTADGTYQVRLSIVSEDGRTGTTTRPVTVNTHDVSITKFSVPAKAKTGETKPIAVHVANTRYREQGVTVELYKSDGRSWTQVGTLTLDVPARPDRTVKFPFAYTFTPADAVVGKVTFRAVLSLPFPVRDARPADNEVIAIATTVHPGPAAAELADLDMTDFLGRVK